ncbi:MAG: aldehyde dehydrogenase family protein [Gammaproteobacteria bacterium]|nr:aldehyde dehydrogenase family protein [Gammaproteobacteria bacterium]
MQNQTRFYINGQWVEPSTNKSLDVVSPATEQVIGRVAMGNNNDVDTAVAAARCAFDSFSQTVRKERIELLEEIINKYKLRIDDIAVTISEEMGAPISLARSVQAPMGLNHLLTTLAVLREYGFEDNVGSSCVLREPVGICGFITPWNWPINQITCKVAPALAAGCTMILKPSEIAPFNAILFTEILAAAGVPAGVFNLVNGDGPTVGAALSSHPDIDMISFTGSVQAGIDIAQNAAPTVKRVAQELGGKAANILLDDADFQKAITRDVGRLCTNSGQSCISPSRMLVPEQRMDETATIAKQAIERIKVGNPRDSDTKMGPVVSQSQFDKIQRLIQAGLDEGAKLVAGGLGRPDGMDIGFYVKPTVFSHVTQKMKIAREEIFGPVLCIMGYTDENNALRIANDTTYGLSGYVSSGNLERARTVARRIRAGSIFINGALPDNKAPFGGYKQSGNGREGGRYGLEEFLEIKAVTGAKSKSK